MSTIIRELHAEPLDLPLWEPFKIATGMKEAAWNVLIRVVLEDGTTGFGEVARAVSLPDEPNPDFTTASEIWRLGLL